MVLVGRNSLIARRPWPAGAAVPCHDRSAYVSTASRIPARAQGDQAGGPAAMAGRSGRVVIARRRPGRAETGGGLLRCPFDAGCPACPGWDHTRWTWS